MYVSISSTDDKNRIVLSVFTKTTERLQLVLLLWLKRRRKRRYWVHPIFQQRETFGEYHHLMQQVLNDEEKCLAYIRMRPDTLKTLLEIIGPHIEKRTTAAIKSSLQLSILKVKTEKLVVNLMRFYFRSKKLSIQKTCWLCVLSVIIMVAN